MDERDMHNEFTALLELLHRHDVPALRRIEDALKKKESTT